MRKLLITFMTLYSMNLWAQDIDAAKAECEELMNAALPFAEQMLQEHGEFFPYGAVLKRNGEIESIAGFDGREQPPSSDIMDLLREGFIQGARAGNYRATALIYDVRVTLPSSGQQSDAIAVSLDHKNNYSVVVFFPYDLRNGEIIFGEAFTQRGENEVFSVQ